MSEAVHLAEEVLAALERAHATLATAESLTGGLVGATVTEVPGASRVFRGGVVVYATDMKATLLGVDPAVLAAHGAVHGTVAAQMAAGVRDRFDATYGLALTGVAGPDPQDGQPPGTLFVAVAGPGDVRVHSPVPPPGQASRSAVREFASGAGLRLLLDVVRS